MNPIRIIHLKLCVKTPALLFSSSHLFTAPEFKSDLNEEMKRPNKSNQIDQHSLTVEFPTNPFTDKNGRIINYTVLVATTNKKELNQSSVLPNWYQFNKNPSINAYQVISNCTNLYQVNNTCNKKTTTSRMKRSTDMKSVKFKIGVDDCSKENSSYCNGYLKPGTNYYVKVRAYTHDAFQDTPFSMAIQTESESEYFICNKLEMIQTHKTKARD